MTSTAVTNTATTKVRMGLEGVVRHRHPVEGKPEGRWHMPHEAHPTDPTAHAREHVEHYEGELTADQKKLYLAGLAGDKTEAMALLKAYVPSPKRTAKLPTPPSVKAPAKPKVIVHEAVAV